MYFCFSSQQFLNDHYDYIITGSGCAGLSLLYRMMQHSFFSSKQILVIDEFPKSKNDHTWCFWEKQHGIFEEVVYHKWNKLNFYSDGFSSRLEIYPYEYKMIRAIDFYNYILGKATQYSNIHFYFGTVEALQNENDKAIALADGQRFYADNIFNSILFRASTDIRGTHHLLQHFKGWFIETPSDVFDERIATFMDFRINQQHGTCFVYVLPVSQNNALIEYRSEEYTS